MTNGEKYKTALERAEAFRQWYITECHAEDDYVSENDCFSWLDLEAKEEEPLPCPFCGKKFVSVIQGDGVHEGQHAVECYKDWCYYRGPWKITESEAIAAHNRVAKAVREVKK